MKTSINLSIALPKVVVILFLFFGVLALPALAAENYQVGNKLYVAPTYGVNIRTAPSLQAPVLAKLKYNSIVTVVADSVAAKPLQIKVSDFNQGFVSLQGHWVKIKSGKMTGYVFDGMLSKLKGLELGNYKEAPYYENTFGKPSKETIKKNQVVQGHSIDYETVITTYPRGLKEEYTFFDDCHDLTYTFNMSFNEAYWLIERMLLGGDAVQDANITRTDENTVLTFYSCT